MEIADFKEIAPLLTGIITATAAILAVAVTSLFNLKVARINIEAQSKQKTKELRLERLEELYLLFDKWERNFANVYLIYYRCYMEKLRYEETHELIQKQNILAPNEAQKYKMIMMVHFPSLAPAYEPVEAGRKLLVPFLTDPSKSALSPREFVNFQKSFEKACETFKSEISSLAHITTGTEKHS